jgi:hypothetical protein
MAARKSDLGRRRQEEHVNERPRRLRRQNGGRKWVWIGLALGGILVLVGGGVAIFLLRSSGEVNPRVTYDNFQKLKFGVPFTDVENLLGPGSSLTMDQARRSFGGGGIAKGALVNIGFNEYEKFAHGSERYQWRNGNDVILMEVWEVTGKKTVLCAVWVSSEGTNYVAEFHTLTGVMHIKNDDYFNGKLYP